MLNPDHSCLVPMVSVGTSLERSGVPLNEATRETPERPGGRSHAERGNEMKSDKKEIGF